MEKLKKIEEEIGKCSKCKEGKFGLPVPGEGNSTAKIMFIGEAPGRREAETGRPFVGRAGKLLTLLLASIKIERKDVFITSPVKYYPGKRAPKISEIKHGKVHLLKQIETIKPRLIVLLGKVAHRVLIEDMQITKVHGRRITKDGRIYFSTFHPAAALRLPKIKKILQQDFAKLKKICGQEKIIL